MKKLYQSRLQVLSDLVFFTSPIGLGHATRDIAISENLANHSKLFVSGGPASCMLSIAGFDVKDRYRPPPFETENGNLKKPLKWLYRYYTYYKDCKEIASEVISKSLPQLVVSDEDFASLTVAQEKRIKTVLVTDILETSFAKGIGSIIEKKMNRSMCEIIKKCDLVIMPEDGDDEGNIVRVGPIVRRTLSTREHLRQKFAFNKKTIVVSIGGTDTGRFLIEKAYYAFQKSRIDADFVVVSGPSLDVKLSNVRNLGFVENLHEVIFASDVIISLAGKSTIDEAAHYGTPGIFIPLKGHFEQEENAKDVGFSYNDICNLEKLLSAKISEKRNPHPFNGAEKASKLINDFFN